MMRRKGAFNCLYDLVLQYGGIKQQCALEVLARPVNSRLDIWFRKEVCRLIKRFSSENNSLRTDELLQELKRLCKAVWQ